MTELLMTILLRHCEDLPGEWNAFCPKLGIMTQGTGIQEATDMIQDAILLSLGEDGLEGLPTGDHSEEWKLIRQVMKDGKPLAFTPRAKTAVFTVQVRGNQTEAMPFHGYLAL